MPREKVEFVKNVEEEISLAYATGREGENDRGAYWTYTTTDDRIFFATPTLNQKIQALGPKVNERLLICLRNSRETGGKNLWDVRRAPGRPLPPADDRGVEPPAVLASANTNGHTNGSSHNGNGHNGHNGNGTATLAEHLEPAPPIAMNGRGETALRVALRVTIDEVAWAEKYAASLGMSIRFAAEDIRMFTNTQLINNQRGGR